MMMMIMIIMILMMMMMMMMIMIIMILMMMMMMMMIMMIINSIQRRTFARTFEDCKFILLFPHCRDKILLSTHNDSRSLSSAKASEGINDRLLLIMDLQNYSGIS